MKPVFSPVTQLNCPHCQAEVPLDGLKHMDQVVCQSCEKKVIIPAPFDEYLIYDQMSFGPHCSKYRAFNQTEGRPCVLKVLNEESDVRMKDAHLDLHRRIAKLVHPNLNLIFRIDIIDGTYFVEEQLHPRSLRHLFYSEGRLSELEALTMVRDIASALSMAHTQLSINHLNITGKAIRIDSAGGAIVSDFCHHRLGEPERKLIGAPKYVSPEAILFATSSHNAPPPGPQADIFSLGVVLYRLLSHRPPYSGDSMEMLQSRFTDKPEPLSKLVDISEGTQEIVKGMMALKLIDRYTAMSQVFDALNDQISQLGDHLAESSFTEDIEIAIMEGSSLGNDDSGPHAVNQQILAEAIDNLYETGALEYAAPADESQSVGMITQHIDTTTADTQKVEINKTEIEIPKPKVIWQKDESAEASESVIAEAAVSAEASDSDIAIDSHTSKSRLASASRTASASRSRQASEMPKPKPLWLQAVVVFLVGMAGGVVGFLLMQQMMPRASILPSQLIQDQTDKPEIAPVPIINPSQAPAESSKATEDPQLPAEAGHAIPSKAQPSSISPSAEPAAVKPEKAPVKEVVVAKSPVKAAPAVKSKRLPKTKVGPRVARQDVLEAEQLKIIKGQASTIIVDHERLSGKKLMAWKPPQKGSRLDIAFETKGSSNSLVLGVFKNMAMGKFNVYLNNEKIIDGLLLYAPKFVALEVVVEKPVPPGAHVLTFRCVGKARAAKGMNLGLDYIALPEVEQVALAE